VSAKGLPGDETMHSRGGSAPGLAKHGAVSTLMIFDACFSLFRKIRKLGAVRGWGWLGCLDVFG